MRRERAALGRLLSLRGNGRRAAGREAGCPLVAAGRAAMELAAARRAVLAAVRGTCAADLPRLLHWMRHSSKRPGGGRLRGAEHRRRGALPSLRGGLGAACRDGGPPNARALLRWGRSRPGLMSQHLRLRLETVL